MLGKNHDDAMDANLIDAFGEPCGDCCLKHAWRTPWRLIQVARPHGSRRVLHGLVHNQSLFLSREANSWSTDHDYGRAIDRSASVHDDRMLDRFRDNPHPNMAGLLDYCDCTIRMEYVVGRLFDGEFSHLTDDLQDLSIARSITASRLEELIAQVRTGIEHLHRLGYAHTDLMGANVIVTVEGVARIIDLVGCVPLTPGMEAFDWFVFDNWFVKPAVTKNREGVTFTRQRLLDGNREWMQRVRTAQDDLAGLSSPGDRIIVVDENRLPHDQIGVHTIPFLERNGEYWGPPHDGLTAIHELERLRRDGATMIAFAWPAFWWLEHYDELHRYLRENFDCRLDDDRLVVFDLTRRPQEPNP